MPRGVGRRQRPAAAADCRTAPCRRSAPPNDSPQTLVFITVASARMCRRPCPAAAASSVAATWSATTDDALACSPSCSPFLLWLQRGRPAESRQHPERMVGDRLSENGWPCAKISSAPRVLNRLAPISPLITTTVSHLPMYDGGNWVGVNRTMVVVQTCLNAASLNLSYIAASLNITNLPLYLGATPDSTLCRDKAKPIFKKHNKKRRWRRKKAIWWSSKA